MTVRQRLLRNGDMKFVEIVKQAGEIKQIDTLSRENLHGAETLSKVQGVLDRRH